MDAAEVNSRIKQIIGSIAGIDPQRIGDEAALRGDLNLDSLSLLEIGVDVDLAFQLNLPDEAYREIDSLPAMVALVMRRTAELAGAGGPEAAAPAASPAGQASPASPPSRASAAVAVPPARVVREALAR